MLTSASGASFGFRPLDWHAAQEDLPPERRTVAELGSRFLVALILEQPANQLLARIAAFVLVLVLPALLLARQQLARLDVRQRGCHQQVLARDVHVQRAHQVEVLEVLLGDEGNGDVENAQLVPLDQVQQ